VGTDPRVPARVKGALPDGVVAGYAVGLHPQELPGLSDDDVAAAFSALDERLAREPDIVAIGETGLDARKGIGDADDALARQRRVFGRHLAIARRTGLPLVLHGVRRDGPMLQVLDDDIAAHGPLPGAVWHGYSGSRDTMKLATARGVAISIGFMALDDRARRLREAIPFIPDHLLLLETDAPPLAPSRLVDVAAAVAALRGQTLAHVAEITSANARRLFGFG
jgi:TatD DNase family protein